MTIAIPVLLTALYISVFRNYTELAYQNQSPDWFNSIINWVYPRFEVEKTRYPLEFFLNKTDQMIIRTWIVFSGITLLYYLTQFHSTIKTTWNLKLDKTITDQHSKLLFAIFSILLIVTTSDWWIDFYRIDSIAPFYKPILLYRFFGLSLPGTMVLEIFYAIMIIGAILTVFNVRPKVFFTLTMVIFIYLQGLYYCFEKIDHGYVTFTYGGICLIILSFVRKGESNPKWPITLAQILISLVYFQAGLEKLLLSDFNWANNGTFQSYLFAHPTKAGLWLADHDLLCQVLSWTTVIMQLTFPIILFKPKIKWVYLIWGILFHFGTTFFMGISSYLNPWIFSYIFFIDWSLLPNHGILKKNLARINQYTQKKG